MDDLNVLRLAGLVGLVGSVLYAAGDVLLLAPTAAEHRPRQPLPVDVSQDRVLRRRVALLENLACLPPWRLRWGALLGVMGAPLTVAGWLFYRGLLTAGSWTAVPPTILFLGVAVVGPFVHGSFAYVGDTVQLLYEMEEVQRASLVSRVRGQVVTLMLAYVPLLLAAIIASVLAAAATVSGGTRFPAWMGAVNPVTMTMTWLLVKRGLPARAAEYLQGAGFNIAYGAWFAAMTMTIR
jgi:hypothetical protein